MSKRSVSSKWTKLSYSFPEKEKIELYSEKITETGCWIWMRGTTNGYGMTSRRSGSVTAHRVSYEVFNGEIPSGMFVCHRCDTKACVNPSHLFVGTPKDNQDDMRRKGRDNYCGPKDGKRLGSSHPNSKLKESDVIEIRRLLGMSVKRREIQQIFGVSKATVQKIATNEYWTHV